MIYIFVDANALLSFYAYSSDDIAQLEKLVGEVAAQHVKLLVTDQLRREVLRNRENKIAETFKNFYANNDVGQFPRLIQHYEEFAELNVASATYKDLKNKIRRKLDLDIKERNLPADKILKDLLSADHITITTDELLGAARGRVERGDPPGKKGSIGDALNWEHLLKHCPSNSDLYFVTNDADFLSPIDKARFSEFLQDEWQTGNGGKVFFFRGLRELFKQIKPDIQLSEAANEIMASPPAVEADWSGWDATEGDQETPFDEPLFQVNPIEVAVRALEHSNAFRITHFLIAQMPDVDLLQQEQAKRLFHAAVQNGQISSIANDEDVAEFFGELYQKRGDLLDDDIRQDFLGTYVGNQQ